MRGVRAACAKPFVLFFIIRPTVYLPADSCLVMSSEPNVHYHHGQLLQRWRYRALKFTSPAVSWAHAGPVPIHSPDIYALAICGLLI
jgi:hypothetical protein